MLLKEVMIVGTGGFIGSALRFALSSAMVNLTLKSGFPLGTLAVNIIGSLLIGVFMTAIDSSSWYQLCVIGFCGGFTTFSTFSSEVFNNFSSGNSLTALCYIIISVVTCMACVGAGVYIGNRI